MLGTIPRGPMHHPFSYGVLSLLRGGGSTVRADTLEGWRTMGFRKEAFFRVIADYNQQVRSGKMAMPFGPPPGGDQDNTCTGAEQGIRSGSIT